MPAFTEWLNRTAYTRYPFADTAGMRDTRDVYTIPNELFLEASFSVPDVDGVPSLRVSEISAAGSDLVIVVSDADGTIAGSVAIDGASHEPGQAHYVEGAAGTVYAPMRGLFILGDLEKALADTPDGRLTFATAFLGASTVRPYPDAVTSLSIRGAGGSNLSSLVGDVALRAGNNIRLTYLESQNAIRIDAISSRGFVETGCDCETEYEGRTEVRSINGVSSGAVTLVAGDGLRIETSSGRIEISNTEHTPCCECPELEELVRRIRTLDSVAARVENYAAELNAAARERETRLLALVRG